MRRRRVVILMTYRALLLACVGMLVLAGIYASGRVHDWVRRQRYGVRPGVTCLGEPFGGRLPNEVISRLRKLGPGHQRPPVDAVINGASGVVTPEQEGRRLDISATAARIRGASSGQEVTPEWITVYPRVRAAMFGEIRLGVVAKSQVSLMFNVAWGEEFLPGILDVLNKAGVRATFFVDGHWGRMFPALVRRLAAEGHDVATHGAEHVDPTKLAPAEIRALIEDGTAVLKAAGVRPKRIFAPPAGACSPAVCRVAAELGYWTVLWTADTVDWQRPAPEVIADRVFRKVKKGALVLMHPTSPTLTALPGIIDGLHQMGYQLVPVSAQLPPTLE